MDLEYLFSLKLWGLPVGTVCTFLLKVFVIYAFTHAAVFIVKLLFKRSMQRKGKVAIEQQNLGFFQRIIVYTIYIVGGTAFLQLIPGMEQVGKSVLAGAGIMAMAVGLASQEALKNFVGGIFIVISKPFRINDLIEVAGVKGTVEEITLRHTIIRTADNQKIIIPNATINSSNIINSTIGEKAKCAIIDVGISYDSDINRAIAFMREEISAQPQLIDHRSKKEIADGVDIIVIRVVELAASSVQLRAWAWTANAGDAFVLKCNSLKTIKERFDKEGVNIPFTTYTIKQN